MSAFTISDFMQITFGLVTLVSLVVLSVMRGKNCTKHSLVLAGFAYLLCSCLVMLLADVSRASSLMFFLPIPCCVLAVWYFIPLRKTRREMVNLNVFFSLVVTFIAQPYFPNQGDNHEVDTYLPSYLLKYEWDRVDLREGFPADFVRLDTLNLSAVAQYLDKERQNKVYLVRSYGVPLDSVEAEQMFDLLPAAKIKGVEQRKHSNTKMAAAEIHHLIDSLGVSDSVTMVITSRPDMRFEDPFEKVETAYRQCLDSTLKQIAMEISAFPEVRFIVIGDHEPIYAPKMFQEKFYKRWVPFAVFN